MAGINTSAKSAAAPASASTASGAALAKSAAAGASASTAACVTTANSAAAPACASTAQAAQLLQRVRRRERLGARQP
eukprot:5497341-Prymnesium_polylepis.1